MKLKYFLIGIASGVTFSTFIGMIELIDPTPLNPGSYFASHLAVAIIFLIAHRHG